MDNRYKTRTKNTLIKRKENFIKKASIKHNDRFDYSKVEYVNAFTPVTIICPMHGEFFQKPKEHTSGAGCSICGRSRLGWNVWGTREQRKQKFIETSNLKHAFRYDYSKVKFVDGKTKVEIVCPTHGSFFQTPDSHMNTVLGCSKCKSPRGESLVRWWCSKHDIITEEQKSFETCVYKKQLKFDFYIPHHNLLIECNGKQHYQYSPIFHKKNKWNTFAIQQERDKIKSDWARNNNIELLIIPFDEYDNIFDILSKRLLP